MIEQVEAAAEPLPAPLAVVPRYEWALDLLQPFDSLLGIGRMLAVARPDETDTATGDPLTNLYLLVCALDQMVGDLRHSGFYDLARAGRGARSRRALAAVSAAQGRVAAALPPGLRALERLDRDLLDLARRLAHRILEGERTPGGEAADRFLAITRRRLPARLRQMRLKLPQSFRGVDLYPEDCVLLGRRAAARLAKRERIAVVGLRTSGLYMAPLCAAAIEAHLGRDVELLSLRPGAPLLRAEERSLRDHAAAGGAVFVVDDPTWRGSAFSKATGALTRLGFSAGSVLLAACEIANQPVFRLERGDPSLTEGEAKQIWQGFPGADKVLLEEPEWHVHTRLGPAVAATFLNHPATLGRLGATAVRVVRCHPFTAVGQKPPALAPGDLPRRRQRRFHAHAVLEVEVIRGSVRSRELVLARGVGLGFFGYHSFLLAARLNGSVPLVLGIERGVLYLRWESRAGRVTALSAADLDAISGYVARRATATRLPERSPAPASRLIYTGARQVSRLLSRTMGGVGALAQFRDADALTRDLASPLRSVVDARMGPEEWVRRPDGSLAKLDFEEHGVDITDRCVEDPVHDLAAAQVGFGLGTEAADRLLAGYVRESGDDRSLGARMLFHQLLSGAAALEAVSEHGWSPPTPQEREDYAGELAAAEDLLTRAVNTYLSRLYLGIPVPRVAGDVWAIDLDDTLEWDRLGFQATSPAGVLALRTLRAHGHQAILTTGRSLAEVRDRCATYGLAGGVAEYGAVAWDERRRQSIGLLGVEARHQLERLREAVATETDIMADPRYEHSLRLFRHTPDGRRGMPAAEVELVIERHGISGLEVVEGFRKTVVWAAGTDKAAAVPILLRSLGLDGRRLHAVGDEFTDLALMELAAVAHAPGNATAAVRARARDLGIDLARRGRQAGVLEIVQRALHGRRAFCACCAPPALERADATLVRIMSVQDWPRWRRLARALHPASLRAFER